MYFANLTRSDLSVLIFPSAQWPLDPQNSFWRDLREQLRNIGSFEINVASDLMRLFQGSLTSSQKTIVLQSLKSIFEQEGVDLLSDQSKGVFDIRNFTQATRHFSPEMYWLLLEKPYWFLLILDKSNERICGFSASQEKSWIANEEVIQGSLEGRLWQIDNESDAHPWTSFSPRSEETSYPSEVKNF